MHGLVNRSIQLFLQETYGQTAWESIAHRADAPVDGFEAMLIYDDALTDRLLKTASQYLDKPATILMEDLGTFLVAHPKMERLRRLLRFGGADFLDFLHSLDDLPGRARLAVPDLEMPELELRQYDQGLYCLTSRGLLRDSGHLMLGVLSAMADDYGSLVLLGHDGGDGAADMIRIELLDTAHSEGRSFSLAGGGGAAP